LIIGSIIYETGRCEFAYCAGSKKLNAGCWRRYYIHRGEMLIVMLGGGDKSTQAKDIVAAKALAVMIKE